MFAGCPPERRLSPLQVKLSLGSAAILSLVAFAVYLSTGLLHVTPDTVPARYLPVSVLRHGHLYLDPFPEILQGDPYYARRVGDHWVSRYSPVPALLAVPFYLPILGGSQMPLESFEKLAAAGLTALSVGVVFLALRAATTLPMAWFGGLAYAFGAGSFNTSSHGLWQHGPGQLMLALSLLCLVRGRTALAGLPLGWAVVIRPPNLVLAVCLAGYVAVHRRRQLPGLLLAALPAVAFQFWYNAAYLGGPWRFSVGPNGEGADQWGTPLWVGLSGLLFSPGRGLFLYSPVFLLSLVGIGTSLRRGGDPLVRWLGLASALLLAVVSKFIIWWGGDCFGPRYLVELTPWLVFCFYPLEPWLARSFPARVLAGVLLALSIAANALGAYSLDAWRWSEDLNVNEHRERLWRWTDNPLAIPLLAAFNRGRIALEGLPTAVDGRVSYSQPHLRRFEDRLELELDVRNLGGSVWRTRGQDVGRIWLGWRYWAPGQAERVLEGRVGLSRDVFPGESYRIETSLPLPSMTGSYRLEVGMVSESVAWFPGPLLIQIGPTSVGW